MRATYTFYTFFMIPMMTVETNSYFFTLKIHSILIWKKIDVHSSYFRLTSKFRIESNQSIRRHVSCEVRINSQWYLLQKYCSRSPMSWFVLLYSILFYSVIKFYFLSWGFFTFFLYSFTVIYNFFFSFFFFFFFFTDSVLSTRYSALSTQHSALHTQHSAFSEQPCVTQCWRL